MDLWLQFIAKYIIEALMKRLAFLVLIGFGLGACERHDFKETRKLQEHHDAHGHGDEKDAAH
jgi:hypothetical protein